MSTDSKMADKEDQLLIAAIDFGTTHSGYAFSFENDYKVDPLKISTNQNNWVAGSWGLVSLKAPTCVLLSPRQEFIAFGYEAEDLYSELAFDENHHDHYFFKGFKMVINEKRVSAIRFKQLHLIFVIIYMYIINSEKRVANTLANGWWWWWFYYDYSTIRYMPFLSPVHNCIVKKFKEANFTFLLRIFRILVKYCVFIFL